MLYDLPSAYEFSVDPAGKMQHLHNMQDLQRPMLTAKLFTQLRNKLFLCKS